MISRTSSPALPTLFGLLAGLLPGCFDPEPPAFPTGTDATGDGDSSTSVTPTDASSSSESTSSVATDETGSSSTESESASSTEESTGEPAVCGNGIVDADEECDDTRETASCDADCTFAVCGDLVVNAAALELCDDDDDDSDECAGCQTATCGDGYVWLDNERCDDANAIDVDACTNTCAFGNIQVSGNANTPLADALTALGETFVANNVGWPLPGSAGVLIIGHDGSDANAPNYQAHIDAGAHLLLVGGSSDPAYVAWSNGFITNTGESSWHQSSACESDWNMLGEHPITALLPAAYEFADPSVSYHMTHFASEGQLEGTVLLGNTCEVAPNNVILATRRFPSGGTFTYMAFDIGAYSTPQSGPEFVEPFLRGYLDYLRSPPAP